MRLFLCLSVLLILVAACRGEATTRSDELPLQGTTWTLERIDIAGDDVALSRDEVYTILLDTAGVVRGQADCNECTGGYHFQSDNSLAISMSCAEAACRESGSSVSHFPVYLSGVFDHAVDGEVLTLQKRQSLGSLELEFRGE